MNHRYVFVLAAARGGAPQRGVWRSERHATQAKVRLGGANRASPLGAAPELAAAGGVVR